MPITASERDTLRLALQANAELQERNRELRARVAYLEKRDRSRRVVAGIQSRRLVWLPWRGFVS